MDLEPVPEMGSAMGKELAMAMGLVQGLEPVQHLQDPSGLASRLDPS